MEDSSIEEQRCSSVTPAKEMLTPSFMQHSDMKLLEDETFDFDLPVSPAIRDPPRPSTSRLLIPGLEEEEEEIFIGPVGLREQCAAKVVHDVEQERRPMSPLSPSKLVEIFIEAHKVANHFKNEGKKNESPKEQKVDENRVPLPPAPISKPVVLVSSPPPKKKLFSLDWNSPCMDTSVEEIKVADIAMVEEETKSSLQRTRSLRLPGLSRSGSTCLPKPGLKRPVLKRQRTSSESSPANLSTNSSTSSSTNSLNTSRFGSGPRKLQRPNPATETTARKSPRLLVPQHKSPARLKSPSFRRKSPMKSPAKQRKENLAPVPKPSMLKGPLKKLELVKPSGLQKKFGQIRSKLGKPGSGIPGMGPLKAAGPMKVNGDSKMNKSATKMASPPKPVKPRAPPPSMVASPSKSVRPRAPPPMVTTPMKKEKVIEPKKLIAADSSQMRTPKKSDGGSLCALPATPQSMSKRRSFLPTPGRPTPGRKASTASSCNSSLHRGSSLSSTASMDDSPAFNTRHHSTSSTPVGLLVDLSDDTSTSSLNGFIPDMSSKSRVLHTPLMKEISVPKKPSTGWTPVRRARPADPSDEYIVCTKRPK